MATWRRRPRSKLRSLHRWAGIFACAFLFLLATTGVLLNHAASLGLDRRAVDAAWLLDWYGVENPSVTRAYADGGSYAALVGDRIYVDGHEVVRGVADLRGLVRHGEAIAVATDRELLLAGIGGALLDRLRIGQIEALGRAPREHAVVVRTQTGLEAFRPETFEPVIVATGPHGASEAVRWTQPVALAADQIATLERAHRGAGVTLERLMLDLHSGRLLGSFGTLVMDFAGVLAILLAATGLILWRKPRR